MMITPRPVHFAAGDASTKVSDTGSLMEASISSYTSSLGSTVYDKRSLAPIQILRGLCWVLTLNKKSNIHVVCTSKYDHKKAGQEAKHNIGERGQAGWYYPIYTQTGWLPGGLWLIPTWLKKRHRWKSMAVQCKKKAAASKLKSPSPLGLLLIALVSCYPRGTTSPLQVPLFLDEIHLPVGKRLWDRRKSPLQPHLSWRKGLAHDLQEVAKIIEKIFSPVEPHHSGWTEAGQISWWQSPSSLIPSRRKMAQRRGK